MAKKWQHYVPRVYTKAWETTVYTKKEPDKPFEGVYYYERTDLSKGDGRNNGSILAKNHTYTIDFNYTFILSRCPKIRIEFAEEIKKLLRDRKIKAYFKGKPLSNRNAISSNLIELDNWEFFNLDNTPASKKSNINAIKEIRSYCLEDKFGSYVEDRWEAILKKFLAPFPKSNGTGQIEFSHPDTQAITKMIEMLAVMMCRNPSFDLLGAFSWMKDEILIPIYSQYGYVAEAEVIIRGVWLTEIYKGLYGKTGFVDSFISSAFSKLGIVVFRVANDNEGSFITSDNPVVYYNFRIESHNSNGIYFPLTPQYMLFLGKRSEGNVNDVVFSTVHNEDIRRINRIILNSAETGIVSTKQYLGHIL